MKHRWKPRLSYANVIASLALFIALGGGAYATHAHKITTQDLRNQAVSAAKIQNNAIVPNKIRRAAVRPLKIAPEAIYPAHIRDGAVRGPKIADGNVTLEKLDAESVGAGFQPRSDIIYASVDALGNLQEPNSRGAVSSTRTGNGQYSVEFFRDVSGCAWFPSRSAIGTGIPANGDFLGVGGQVGAPEAVRVRIRNQNNIFANRSFSLLVVC